MQEEDSVKTEECQSGLVFEGVSDKYLFFLNPDGVTEEVSHNNTASILMLRRFLAKFFSPLLEHRTQKAHNTEQSVSVF